MAGQNKFEKMLKQNSNARAVSSDARLEREVRKQNLRMIKDRLKEFKFSDPENYKKAKILSKKHHINLYNFIGVDLSAYDNKGNLFAGMQDVSIIKDEHPESFSISEKTENGKTLQQNNIEYQDSPIEQVRAQQANNFEPENSDEESENNQSSNAETDSFEVPENPKEDFGSDFEAIQDKTENFEEEQKPLENESSENEPSPIDVQEKPSENINHNSHISKIDFSEIEKIKNEIMRENGQLPEESSSDDVAENKQEPVSDENYEQNQEPETSETKPNKKQKRGLFSFFKGKEQKNNESFYEDLSNAQTETPEEIETPEVDEFEGMSEEEIAIEKERRRRLADLKQKYSDEGAKDPNDIGEYKKSLDFSINLDIKHFKVKPPKKPIIISLICVFLALITAGVVTFFVLRKPPEPPHLVSAKLSQQTTYQYVGDTVDLRGIYIEEVYSDKSKQTIAISSSMISRKSANIDQNLKIVSNSANTFIEFVYNDKTQRLVIVLNEMTIAQIESIEIYQDSLANGSVLKFENILVLAQIVDSNGLTIGTKRLSAKDAKFEIDGIGELEKTENGVILSGVSAGTVQLKISFVEKDNTFEKKVSILIIE